MIRVLGSDRCFRVGLAARPNGYTDRKLVRVELLAFSVNGDSAIKREIVLALARENRHNGVGCLVLARLQDCGLRHDGSLNGGENDLIQSENRSGSFSSVTPHESSGPRKRLSRMQLENIDEHGAVFPSGSSSI